MKVPGAVAGVVVAGALVFFPGPALARHHAKNGQHASHDTVRQAQQTLNDLGYDAGTPDGVMGPKTRVAVKKFQQDKSLEASGRLDPKTLDALGVHADSSTSGTRGSQGEGGGAMGREGSQRSIESKGGANQ